MSAPGASLSCTARHTIVLADMDAGSFYNQACVYEAEGGIRDTSVTGVQTCTLPTHLTITKVATESGYSAVGQVIHYTIVASNDGNTTLAAVTVTDAQEIGRASSRERG